MNANSWHSNKVTWDNKPKIDGTLLDEQDIIDCHWTDLDVSDIVKNST